MWSEFRINRVCYESLELTVCGESLGLAVVLELWLKLEVR